MRRADVLEARPDIERALLLRIQLPRYRTMFTERSRGAETQAVGLKPKPAVNVMKSESSK